MSTTTITLPKTKYDQLIAIAERFEMIKSVVEPVLFNQPPTKNTKKILKEFKDTKCYNKEFLKSLEQGLEESVYFHST